MQPVVGGQNTGDRKLSQQVWVMRRQSLGASGILWSPAAVKTVSLGPPSPLTFSVLACFILLHGTDRESPRKSRAEGWRGHSDSSEGSFRLLCFGSRCPLPRARARVEELGSVERGRPRNKSKHLSLRVGLVLSSGPGFCLSFEILNCFPKCRLQSSAISEISNQLFYLVWHFWCL